MQTVNRIARLREAVDELRAGGGTVALVPTMGALHEGHLALVRDARRRADRVVVSIFVNPTQFGPGEDLDTYPRRLAQDQALLEAEGVAVLWAPGVEEMYPHGFATTVSVTGVNEPLEGASRPGHLDGVATVVLKLFEQVCPDIAVFGEKDWQQLAVIRRMARDLDLTRPRADAIVGMPTVREADGLALSSRNAYLTERQRRAAPLLYRALQAGATAVKRGVTSGALVRHAMVGVIRKEPLIAVDYLAVCDPETLEPLHRIERKAVLLGAIKVGEVKPASTVRTVRLIDNLLVTRRAARSGA